MAKPVGVVQEGGRILVVCEDGSVYRCEDAFTAAPDCAEWTVMPAVPNTDFHERLQRQETQTAGGLQWLGADGKEKRGPATAGETPPSTPLPLPLRESA